MGDPSVDVSKEDEQNALVQKSMAMDASIEGRFLFEIDVVRSITKLEFDPFVLAKIRKSR